MYIDNNIYQKYINKLSIINMSLNVQSTSISEQLTLAYSNYYNLLSDLIDEIGNDITTLGLRINLLADILKNEKTNYSISFISKFFKQTKDTKLSIKKLYSKIFSIMIDAYLDSERDILCFNNLQFIMKKNIFLRNITNREIILSYSEILKEIYNEELNSALTHICEVLASAPKDLDTNFILTKILVNLSAALELPQVYIYSKKMLLEMSMLKHDYNQARIEIRDFEDMHYSTPELKYYKALLKQKEPNNILHYIKHL
ncbi:MAG: hypothetical protein E7314_03100 [Clostridiales bacterium]|nr:hypothetical protein [Clostridiales bacterium]